MQSVPIATNVVSVNPEVYSIQHYVIVCQWLATGRWFSPGIPVSSINKSVHHDITKILLKVALNTITLTLPPIIYFNFQYAFWVFLGFFWFFSKFILKYFHMLNCDHTCFEYKRNFFNIPCRVLFFCFGFFCGHNMS